MRSLYFVTRVAHKISHRRERYRRGSAGVPLIAFDEEADDDADESALDRLEDDLNIGRRLSSSREEAFVLATAGDDAAVVFAHIFLEVSLCGNSVYACCFSLRRRGP
mmetsp:Transcript_42580/g.129206  ORF Transcript_42580/g.129206 Transcript_42580/m.129206 type:complete len:107 (-) Transcript_42580:152-472(-)